MKHECVVFFLTDPNRLNSPTMDEWLVKGVDLPLSPDNQDRLQKNPIQVQSVNKP